MMEWTIGRAAIGKILPAIALLIGSWTDFRYMAVPVPLTTGMLIMGLGYRLSTGQLAEGEMLLCLLPGIFMMIWAKMSGGNLGSGDAWMVLALGTMLDFSYVIGTVCIAFWLAGIMALVIYIRKRKKKMEIPFVPFILFGYMITLALGRA